MSRFSEPQVVVHKTGAPASGTALVGDAFMLPLVYADDEQTPINLTGWALTAKGVLYSCEFDNDGLLKEIGQRIQDSTNTDYVPLVVPVAQSADQMNNTGLLELTIQSTLLPADLRDVDVDAPFLPTVLMWVRLESPGGLIDQARVALGYRTGFDSF